MTYRDDRAAISQRIADLEAHLSGIRATRASLATLEADERAVISELDGLRQRAAMRSDEIKRHLPLVERIEIASPCDVPWDTMVGDDKTRFCGQCRLHVHNLSAMSRVEAESLLSCGGSICVRLYRRADGTVLTQDCPVALRRKSRRRLAIAAVVSASVAAALLGALSAFHRDVDSMRHSESKVSTAAPRAEPIQGEVSEPPASPTPQVAPPPHRGTRMGRRSPQSEGFTVGQW